MPHILSLNESNVSQKVCEQGAKFKQKLQDILEFSSREREREREREGEKCIFTLRTKDLRKFDIAWAWPYTLGNLILGVDRGCSFMFVLL